MLAIARHSCELRSAWPVQTAGVMLSLDEIVDHVNAEIKKYQSGELEIGIEDFQVCLLDFISNNKQSFERIFEPESVVVDSCNRDNAGLVAADVHRSFRLAPTTPLSAAESTFFFLLLSLRPGLCARCLHRVRATQ